MEITFKLISRTEKFDTKTWVDFLNMKSSLLQPTRYGYTEPLKLKIGTDNKNAEAIIALYDYYLSIIFRGKKKFWFSASANSLGLLMCGGGIELKEKELSKVAELIDFMQLFARSGQLLYGYFCIRPEYDALHKVVKGSAYGWEGVSMWDFMDFLPGLHWYTIVGNDLAEAIGRDKFKHLKAVQYTLDNEQAIAFHLDNKLSDWEDNMIKLKQLEAQIGEHYFWGKEKAPETYAHPDSYKEFLKSFNRF
jgi:hypothetical protein